RDEPFDGRTYPAEALPRCLSAQISEMDALQHGRQLVARQTDIEPYVIERPSAGGRIRFEKVGSGEEAWCGASVANGAVEACEVLIGQDHAHVGERITEPCQPTVPNRGDLSSVVE